MKNIRSIVVERKQMAIIILAILSSLTSAAIGSEDNSLKVKKHGLSRTTSFGKVHGSLPSSKASVSTRTGTGTTTASSRRSSSGQDIAVLGSVVTPSSSLESGSSLFPPEKTWALTDEQLATLIQHEGRQRGGLIRSGIMPYGQTIRVAEPITCTWEWQRYEKDQELRRVKLKPNVDANVGWTGMVDRIDLRNNIRVSFTHTVDDNNAEQPLENPQELWIERRAFNKIAPLLSKYHPLKNPRDHNQLTALITATSSNFAQLHHAFEGHANRWLGMPCYQEPKIKLALEGILGSIDRMAVNFRKLQTDYWSGHAINTIEDVDDNLWDIVRNMCEKKIGKRWPGDIERIVTQEWLGAILDLETQFNRDMSQIPSTMECGRLYIMLWARLTQPPKRDHRFSA